MVKEEMNDKSKVEKFMEIMNSGYNAVFGKSKKENFKSSTIKDSDTKVDYSANEVGADVSVASGSGSTVLADGDYTLSNGDSFKVKDGKISEVVALENGEPAEEELSKEDEPKEDEEKVEEVIEESKSEDEPKEDEEKVEISLETEESDDEKDALKAKIEELEEKIKSLEGNFSKIPSKEDFQKEVFAQIMAELDKTPSTSKAVEEEMTDKAWRGFNKSKK